MDYDHYLQTDHKYLYQELANELMKNLERGNDLLHALSESTKYREDYEFRTTVETILETDGGSTVRRLLCPKSWWNRRRLWNCGT